MARELNVGFRPLPQTTREKLLRRAEQDTITRRDAALMTDRTPSWPEVLTDESPKLLILAAKGLQLQVGRQDCETQQRRQQFT